MTSCYINYNLSHSFEISLKWKTMVIDLIETDLKMCLSILVISYSFNSHVHSRKVCDLVSEKVGRINFHISGVGEMRTLLLPTTIMKWADCWNLQKMVCFFFSHKNTVGGRGKGSLIKMTCIFLAKVWPLVWFNIKYVTST